MTSTDTSASGTGRERTVSAPAAPHRPCRKGRQPPHATGSNEASATGGQHRWEQRQRRREREQHGDHRRDGQADAELTPVANIPNSAITTVVPASRIACPDASIAPITDWSTSRRSAKFSRNRVTMNSAQP